MLGKQGTVCTSACTRVRHWCSPIQNVVRRTACRWMDSWSNVWTTTTTTTTTTTMTTTTTTTTEITQNWMNIYAILGQEMVIWLCFIAAERSFLRYFFLPLLLSSDLITFWHSMHWYAISPLFTRIFIYNIFQ